ncbi:YbjN domain-containing protein [Corynebacterium mendelii]|uniref:YbjN domain-containing protein n=1 Tax=Corynebacterium mendelii TaxID=2765362 RepID=A0A939DY69_9CORY|nr:YbjN domain-containing protein [Corynebacterium mendelii]MBN9643153.1 YbjN domain-containing protein [Corynebacterium mendelii]
MTETKAVRYKDRGPVTMDRVADACRDLGIALETDGDDVLIGRYEEVNLEITFRGDYYCSVATYMGLDISNDTDLRDVIGWVNTINRNYRFGTAHITHEEEGHVIFSSRSEVVSRRGLTDDQLENAVGLAVRTCVDFYRNCVRYAIGDPTGPSAR